MSVLHQVSAALRGLQLLISLLFTIAWVWMRTQGFLQLWNTAPPGAYSYGLTLFVLGIAAGVWGLLAAMAHMVLSYVRPAATGGAVQGARIVVDSLALGLFAAVRIVLNTTPAQFLPDILESNNLATVDTFATIQVASGVAIVVAIVLFVISLILVIVQMILARRQAHDEFGMMVASPAMDGPYGPASFDSPYAASKASREPLAMYGAPPATSNSGFRAQDQMYSQPQVAGSTQSVGGVGYATTTDSVYNQSTTSLQNNPAYPAAVHNPQSQPSRNPSVLNAAPLSAIGQAHTHSRGPSAVGQHQRGPSAVKAYHQRAQPSYSSQQDPPASPWAGQTAYGGASYKGQSPPTPGSKPLPSKPTQQAYAAHQQQMSGGNAGVTKQPPRAPGAYIQPGNVF